MIVETMRERAVASDRTDYEPSYDWNVKNGTARIFQTSLADTVWDCFDEGRRSPIRRAHGVFMRGEFWMILA